MCFVEQILDCVEINVLFNVIILSSTYTFNNSCTEYKINPTSHQRYTIAQFCINLENCTISLHWWACDHTYRKETSHYACGLRTTYSYAKIQPCRLDFSSS